MAPAWCRLGTATPAATGAGASPAPGLPGQPHIATRHEPGRLPAAAPPASTCGMPGRRSPPVTRAVTTAPPGPVTSDAPGLPAAPRPPPAASTQPRPHPSPHFRHESFPARSDFTGRFSTNRPSITEATRWLASLGVTHVAMEATGIYSIPVYHALLEHGGLEKVLVCNAGHVKNVPGRKTDLLTDLASPSQARRTSSPW